MKQNSPIAACLRENLSDVVMTTARRDALLREIKGGRKVRAKVSFGLIFAAVLILAASIALAAVLLSMREVVTEKAVPLANQYEGERYTVADTNLLLDIARENGIALSDDAVARIQRDLADENGYYKEELIMAMAKAEFGAIPAQWTLEEQNWFDDVCVAIGFLPEKTRFLPAEGEISLEEALRVALEHIASLGETADVTDAAHFERFVQYLRDADDGSGAARRVWDIEYETKDPQGSSYYLTLSSDGEVTGCFVQQSAVGDSDANAWYQSVYDFHTRTNGSETTWSPAQWVAFKAQIARIPLTQPDLYRPLRAFAAQAYALPDAAALTREQAVDKARACAADKGQDIAKAHTVTAVYLLDADAPVWKVSFLLDDGEFSVELDARTGAARTARYTAFGQPEHRWYARYVLFSVSDTIVTEPPTGGVG